MWDAGCGVVIVVIMKNAEDADSGIVKMDRCQGKIQPTSHNDIPLASNANMSCQTMIKNLSIQDVINTIGRRKASSREKKSHLTNIDDIENNNKA